MKKLITTLTAFFIAAIVFAQVPPAFNYQAVARNSSGVALANQTMKVRLSIIQGSSTVVYSETRTVTTNALGLFNVQIGAAGASNVTGSIGAIDFGNSSSGWYALKVELDLANNNVFTDMGTQPLASVPFSLASETANTAKTVEGFPVANTPAPTVGDRLSWNGTAWAPVKKNTISPVFGLINGIPFTPSGSAPWLFAGPTVTVTVTGTETIFASIAGSLNHASSNAVTVSVSACYENVSGGGIFPFYASNFPDVTITAQPAKTQVTGIGAVVLPAGTYRIGLGIRNKSTTTSLPGNEYVNGVVEVRY
jgi:hypothetical protein